MKEFKRIINSILDNDLYKFTMCQAVFFLFPNIKVRYSFILRKKVPFPEGFGAELRRQLSLMSELRMTKEEKEFLLGKNFSFLMPVFIDFLAGFQYDPSEVGIIQKNGEIEIEITGYWYRTILWEVVLMALISELYFKSTGQEPVDRNERKKINSEKWKKFHINNVPVADFGTRRRYSYDNQDEVIKDLSSDMVGKFFIGTSNVHFAMKHGLKAIGTHAHEWFMVHAALFGYRQANYLALKNWVEVYKGDLGIALSDTFTTDAFFKSFDMKYAKLFDGVRHDSGDPFEFTQKVVAHYRRLGIDPMTKTIVFSDGLDADTAVELHAYCRGKIKVAIVGLDAETIAKIAADGETINSAFGIGTHLTNDVGVTPLNMVIKVTGVYDNGEWIPTIKLSDNTGKHTGPADEIETCKRALRLEKEWEKKEAIA